LVEGRTTDPLVHPPRRSEAIMVVVRRRNAVRKGFINRSPLKNMYRSCGQNALPGYVGQKGGESGRFLKIS
jgi:hypothetical protein